MIESGHDLLALAAISFHYQLVPEVVDIHVPKNAALRIEQESIHTVSRSKVANVVRDHAVQPAHPIFPGERNPRPEAQVINSAAAGKRGKLRSGISKARCSRNP